MEQQTYKVFNSLLNCLHSFLLKTIQHSLTASLLANLLLVCCLEADLGSSSPVVF